MDYVISLQENPQPEVIQAIRSNLVAFNRLQVGTDNYKPLVLTINNAAGETIGGLIGEAYLGWLYIEMLWIKEEIRNSGYGSKLLVAAETKAKEYGCQSAYLDTFSFQALGFYQKHGYVIFGELPDFPIGHSRYFLTKKLPH
jgi:ribosomal protein S18 acetylase RimI-like enzyme